MTCNSAFDPFIKVVLNMMNRFGGDSTLVITQEGTYNPATSTATQTSTVYTVRSLVFDYPDKKDGIGVAIPTEIQKGYKQMFVQPSGFPVPRPNVDKVVYQNRKYTIANVKEVNTTGSNCILYEFMIHQ